MNEKEIKNTLRQFDHIVIPNKEKILSDCEATLTQLAPKKMLPSPRRCSLVAASVCAFLLISVLTVNVFAFEHQEYTRAVDFFKENGLSTDGYSRGEIKRICKDITSESFTYTLTFEAICNSLGMTDAFDQEAITPEELVALWEKKQKDEDFVISHIQNGLAVSGNIADQGISFLFKVQVRNTDTMDDTYSILEKYSDGNLEWSKTIPGFSISKVLHADEHIVLAGVSRDNVTNRALLLLSQDGEIVWQKPVEDIANVLLDRGGIAVIGNGFNYDSPSPTKTKSKLYIAQFTWDGELIRSVSETFYDLNFDYIQYLEASYQEPSYSVDRAIKVGNNYYLVLSCYIQSGKSIAKTQMSIARVSEDGHFEAMYEINEPSTSHRITDIAVRGNELYIGGYYLPSGNGPLGNGLLLDKTEELNSLKATLIAANGSIDDEAFLNMLREHYTGFVVCCDIKTGEIKQIKTAEGATDATFDVSSDGSLVWNYTAIADAKYVIVDDSKALWNAPPYAKIEIVYKDASYIID